MEEALLELFQGIFQACLGAAGAVRDRGPRRLPIASPVTLIDLGANVGLSAVALARCLQADRVVAVEPDASNYALLVENLRSTGLADRCVSVRAFEIGRAHV